MRIEASVTTISWIPSEAVRGIPRLPFSAGVTHYDPPPPDTIGGPDDGGLESLRDADRFRFANRLRAWIEVDDEGRIVEHGYHPAGGGLIGLTRVSLGSTHDVVAAPLPDRRAEPEAGDGWVRFRQTAGGRTGVPAPRRVSHPPFVQWHAPIAWSTVSLTLHADGRVERALDGASPFPRHWLYDETGALVAKTGTTRFKEWWTKAFGPHTPWGDLDSPALVTEVETALERRLADTIMRGARPRIRKVKAGRVLVAQGTTGDELYLLLDGVLAVVHDGEELAEVGPGAILGERAALEGGVRTASLRAVTDCRVAVAGPADLDAEALRELREGHRREAASPAT